MQQILVYGDSLAWGIVPGTRERLAPGERWPGVLERALAEAGHPARVIEDCLNGRRTVWEDPFKAGRNGLVGLEQRIEVNSPLALVILALGTNDLQAVHALDAWHAAQGVAALVRAVRRAPIEPGMPVPPILILAPPPPGDPRGASAGKFAGAAARAAGLEGAYQAVADELDCAFVAAGAAVSASVIDGVHLDAEAHGRLGRHLAPQVAALLR